MDTNNIIGQNIKLYREKIGISQESLSSYLNVNREEVSYFENGKRSIPTTIIEKCARLFGIDEYDLYDENQETKQANVAFAFRADYLTSEDLNKIADFRKIVLNYLRMTKVLAND